MTNCWPWGATTPILSICRSSDTSLSRKTPPAYRCAALLVSVISWLVLSPTDSTEERISHRFRFGFASGFHRLYGFHETRLLQEQSVESVRAKRVSEIGISVNLRLCER